MTDVLLVVIALLTLAVLVLVGVLLAYVRRPVALNLDQTLREEMRLTREDMASHDVMLRREVTSSQNDANQLLVSTLQKMGEDQRRQLGEMADSNGRNHERLRSALDEKFQQILQSNERKLDEMRRTVDEKLQTTLEKRLGESFRLVSERLEAVQQGLGEMKTLATDVGGLKRVLTNVKDRGTWGEYQLGAILGEILTPDQYARNVSPKGNADRVEFAVRLPGKGDGEGPVWLPIDSKFPKEDYERLLDAVQAADMDAVKKSSDGLARAVRVAAKDIHDKYINPPASTDFGIMFLPSEGLYAEVLRQPGLVGEIQNSFRVIVAGPTTLSSILSSLRVGFQTLAIEKRSHEVWNVLGAVKTEFASFGEVLAAVQKKLHEASSTIEKSAVRTRAMQRCLKSVQELPATQAAAVLSLPESGSGEPDDDGDSGQA